MKETRTQSKPYRCSVYQRILFKLANITLKIRSSFSSTVVPHKSSSCSFFNSLINGDTNFQCVLHYNFQYVSNVCFMSNFQLWFTINFQCVLQEGQISNVCFALNFISFDGVFMDVNFLVASMALSLASLFSFYKSLRTFVVRHFTLKLYTYLMFVIAQFIITLHSVCKFNVFNYQFSFAAFFKIDRREKMALATETKNCGDWR